MASEAQQLPLATSSSVSGEQARRELCRLASLHGRLLVEEPQRCEGMLRDLCPSDRRAIFLIMAALREGVVSDLVDSLDVAAEASLVARGAMRLFENLGLSETSARWAVESWIPAARTIRSSPYRSLPGKISGPSLSDPQSAGSWQESASTSSSKQAIDWVWLAICFAGVLTAIGALFVTAHFALYHYWDSFQGWLYQTGQFATGLTAAAGALWLVARGLRSRRVPDHRLLDVNRSAAALLAEVLVLLALPLVPPLTLALWIGEWVAQLHFVGQPHDLAFHFGRMLQSLILAAFLVVWVALMIRIQGRIASSIVRQR
jgi:hypothetical protein